jgi:hypothetical protein
MRTGRWRIYYADETGIRKVTANWHKGGDSYGSEWLLTIQPSLPDEVKERLIKAMEHELPAKYDKVAVVIGMSETPSGKLPGAKADAVEMQKVLQRRGFQVTSPTVNTTLAVVVSTVAESLHQLKDTSTFVFYYAGHSILGEWKENKHPKDSVFLETVDDTTVQKLIKSSEGHKKQDILFHIRRLREWIAASSPSARKVFLWDGCRESPGCRGKGTLPKSVSDLLGMSNTFIAYATSRLMQSKETQFGDRTHGIWTYHLLEALRKADPGTDITAITATVRRGMLESKCEQQPWDESNLTEAIVL